MRRILLLKPVDRRQNLLHLVADDVAANLKRHAVNPFAVRLIGHADARNARPGVGPIDQHGHEQLAAVLGQTTRELGSWLDAGFQAGQHFR